MVNFKKLLEEYKKNNLNYKLPIILGEDEQGKPQFADLVNLGSILMTGTTGSGKSMFEHTIISTLTSLYTPDQLRLYLVDMKRVEFQSYEGLPHLLSPVNKGWSLDDVFTGLEWIIDEKNNRLKIGDEINKYPYIVVIIDTFSDLISHDPQKFQDYISKLMDKAAGVKIYVIMSDSRPSPDVYTPLVLGLFPTKICFNVTSDIDSKLIIGSKGGEELKGAGDMLLLPPNLKEAIRIQAPYISSEEINNSK